MNWTSLVGPAVVAAAIAGIISAIGFLINWATVRRMHSERLAFDREQAERKVSADISLAEKKLSFDRAFAAWKRRTEFAEEVLTDFYQASDVTWAHGRRAFSKVKVRHVREGVRRPRMKLEYSMHICND